MKLRKRFLWIALLMLIFYFVYNLSISKYLTTEASITYVQTMLYRGQIFVWVVVWAVAIWIAKEQIRMSKVQNAIARYQWALWALTLLKSNNAKEEDINEALRILQWLSDDLEKIDK